MSSEHDGDGGAELQFSEPMYNPSVQRSSSLDGAGEAPDETVVPPAAALPASDALRDSSSSSAKKKKRKSKRSSSRKESRSSSKTGSQSLLEEMPAENPLSPTVLEPDEKKSRGKGSTVTQSSVPLSTSFTHQTDEEAGLEGQSQTPQYPGAIRMYPGDPGSSGREHPDDATAFTQSTPATEPSSAATPDDGFHFANAVPVADTPLVIATKPPEDTITEETSSPDGTKRLRRVICWASIAVVLVVIALIVTLVMVFVVNPSSGTTQGQQQDQPSAPNLLPTPAPNASPIMTPTEEQPSFSPQQQATPNPTQNPTPQPTIFTPGPITDSSPSPSLLSEPTVFTPGPVFDSSPGPASAGPVLAPSPFVTSSYRPSQPALVDDMGNSFVEYLVPWYVYFEGIVEPTSFNNQLQLSCPFDGRFEYIGVQGSSVTGVTPVCDASSGLCTQGFPNIIGNSVVVEAIVTFRCYGTDLELVGQASIATHSLQFYASLAIANGALHYVGLVVTNQFTGEQLVVASCSHDPVLILTAYYCGAYSQSSCLNFEACQGVLLEGRTIQQTPPIDSVYIQQG